MDSSRQQMIRQFERLTDTEISRWSGVEMALTEGREGGEVWDHPAIPFLQMLYLDAELADGTLLRFGTDQEDCLCGLSVSRPDDVDADTSGWDGIYRSSVPSHLPCGVVRGVEISTTNSLIEQVRILFEVSSLRLSAGEVYEQHDGSFRIVSQDKSILVQVDGAHPRQNNKVWRMRG